MGDSELLLDIAPHQRKHTMMGMRYIYWSYWQQEPQTHVIAKSADCFYGIPVRTHMCLYISVFFLWFYFGPFSYACSAYSILFVFSYVIIL